MDDQLKFITDVVQSYVPSEAPEEVIALRAILDGMAKQGFTLPDGGGDVSMGLGLDDLAQTLKSPAVIAILASVWTSILAPAVKDIAVKRIEQASQAAHDADLSVKREYARKVREYIWDRGRQAGLSVASSKRLSDEVLRWIKRHPVETRRLID